VRLGIFGGTFDPVHYGHLLLAESCREQAALDAVWFLPTAVPPHKQGRELTPVERRVEMLELATAGHEAFSVCRYEAERGGVNYTADTLAHFREEDPGRELFFLMGADMLGDLPNWYQSERICRLATLVVVRRPGAEPIDHGRLAPIADDDMVERIRRHHVEMPGMGLSGTEIRRRLAAGQSIRYQTPPAVAKYIEAQGLYRGA
jgi:nicotinate-nucleotide adenylyltransferase